MCARWRHYVTVEKWARTAPYLPPQRPDTRRPNHDHRTILNGILWPLRSGAAWHDLPNRYRNWHTIYSRFRRESGIWERLSQALLRA